MHNEEYQGLNTSPEKEFLAKILQSFSTISGLKALLVDKKGNVVVSTGNQVPDCKFCQLIKKSPLGREKCRRSYAKAEREAAKCGKTYVFRCHAGLVAWAVPIIINKHQGAVICGQVLLWEPEDYFLDEIGTMVEGLEVDISEVKKSALALKVLSKDKINAAAYLLSAITNQITNKEMIPAFGKASNSLYQPFLSDTIAKNSDILPKPCYKPSTKIVENFSLQNKEWQLAANVRRGETESAEKLINNIITSILSHNGDDIGDIKARIIELLVILSRGAGDGCMDSKEISSLNSKFFEELYAKETIEEICYWTKNMVRIFSEEVKKSKSSENFQAVYAAADYIQDHFKEKLFINEIAKEVNLSPSYLSHIFSQTFGYTITEYITYVRMEHAKSILSKRNATVSQAAMESGFEDVSYFSRVFRKSEGISPREYKKRNLL